MRTTLKTRYALPEGWAQGLSDAGYAVPALLRDAQLSVERLTDPSPRLTTDEYFRLWRAVERQSAAEAPALALSNRSPTVPSPPLSSRPYVADARRGLHTLKPL